MSTSTEIKIKGLEALRKHLGMVEMEKFISIMQSEKFDYTKWRETLFEGMSGEEISKAAMNSADKK